MGNGLWFAEYSFTAIGLYKYTIEADDGGCNCYPFKIPIWVESSKVRYSTWYQRFPRSCSDRPHRHGTIKEFKKEVQRIADLGFDIIYIPPLNPIGMTNRKGKNGNLIATEYEPGSVWAIGNEKGGHKTIDPQYGDINDVVDLIDYSIKIGVEIAIDIALHCSPDHPYVRQHPEWFQLNNDKSFKYVKDDSNEYCDVIPFNFECADRGALWNELKSIFEFWIERGVSVFRIDNPHTKPAVFWQWVIFELKKKNPEIIFLSEALTNPDKMHILAKAGMSQSYDYFQWKVGKQELTSYYSEIYSPEIALYFKPVLWTNTPQNLPLYLHHKTETAFIIRLILAGTLGASYGIYGPPFEYCINEPLKPGSVEYNNSEQFEIPDWNKIGKKPISDVIRKLNAIRKSNKALQNNLSLRFHHTDNDHVIAYSKNTADFENSILVLVNLDPDNQQHGFIYLNAEYLGLGNSSNFKVHDLLYNQTYLWNNSKNYFELSPDRFIAHIFFIER